MYRRYVADYSDCQPAFGLKGHLQPIPVPKIAFEKVGMDLLRKFPTSECGNR
ncbi:hypothetical protein LAZ67_4004248 [Cordylochernes scorpioides]|uniref:Uncharacterized protein n=1 Tax=Cordylochernes scorpioides TaxID=51811 RepID=A0ABY6KEB6_9ARAC|nr:hypothetical protein LAZ67_4004248 [Cordylochernes scorpioides]